MENQVNQIQEAVSNAIGIDDQQSVEQTQAQAPVQEEQGAETQQTNVEQQNDNSTIRQMREQISSYKREADSMKSMLQKIADEQGITIEQLNETIQTKADKKNAEKLGITPEIAAQMRKQEERIKELEQQNERNDFNNRVNKLMVAHNLNKEQTLEFLQKSQSLGFNPLAVGLDLNTLYLAINYDRTISVEKENIRQQILNEMKTQRESGNSIPVVMSEQNNNSTPNDLSDKDFISAILKNAK